MPPRAWRPGPAPARKRRRFPSTPTRGPRSPPDANRPTSRLQLDLSQPRGQTPGLSFRRRPARRPDPETEMKVRFTDPDEFVEELRGAPPNAEPVLRATVRYQADRATGAFRRLTVV